MNKSLNSLGKGYKDKPYIFADTNIIVYLSKLSSNTKTGLDNQAQKFLKILQAQIENKEKILIVSPLVLKEIYSNCRAHGFGKYCINYLKKNNIFILKLNKSEEELKEFYDSNKRIALDYCKKGIFELENNGEPGNDACIMAEMLKLCGDILTVDKHFLSKWKKIFGESKKVCLKTKPFSIQEFVDLTERRNNDLYENCTLIRAGSYRFKDIRCQPPKRTKKPFSPKIKVGNNLYLTDKGNLPLIY